MKSKIVFLRILLLQLILLIIISISCNESGEPTNEPCGEKINWYSDEIDLKTANYNFTNIWPDSTREYNFEFPNAPEDICTEKHINVTWYVSIDYDAYNAGSIDPDSVKCEGRAYWGGVYGEDYPMHWEGVNLQYEVTQEIGLKNAYQGGTGFIGLQVFISFRTIGDENSDLTFLRDNFSTCWAMVSYNKAK